jgi:O-antigen ligase
MRNQNGALTRAHVVDVVAPFFCVLLLFSGAVKSSPALGWLPFDLTLVSASVVVLGIAIRFVKAGTSFVVEPKAVLLLVAFLPGWFSGVQNNYANDKLQGMLLTVIAVAASFYLLANERRRRYWVTWFVVLGAAVLINGLLFPNVEVTLGRLAAEGSNTITAGRATGAVLVIAFSLLMVSHGASRIALAALAVVFAYGMLESGSRGPVFAAALAVVAVAVFVSRKGKIRRFVLVGIGLVVAWLFITRSSSSGIARIQGAFASDGSATASRDAIWAAAVRYISDVPQSFTGVGWANFSSVLRNGEALDSGDRQYAHNVVLETFVEGGWIAGLATLVFLVLSLVRLRRLATTPVGVVLFAMGVYFVVNAMVSGDVNDNRMMWATLALPWIVPLDQGRVGATQERYRPATESAAIRKAPA